MTTTQSCAAALVPWCRTNYFCRGIEPDSGIRGKRMSEEERQALTGLCKIEIKRWKAASESNPNMRYMSKLMEIALAALTSQPVVSPHEWVHIRLTDRSKSQRMKCQIAWSDSLNSVIYDEEGAPLLISNSAFEVIRAG